MSDKLNYTSEEILNIKFDAKEKGYDALQVDQVFDKMIEDYNSLLEEIKNLSNANNKLTAEFRELKESYDKAQIEVATLKTKISQLPKANGLNQDNYKLMKKVAAYERVLYRKGIDLKKALTDPDNC